MTPATVILNNATALAEMRFSGVARGNTALSFKLPSGVTATPTGQQVTIVIQ